MGLNGSVLHVVFEPSHGQNDNVVDGQDVPAVEPADGFGFTHGIVEVFHGFVREQFIVAAVDEQGGHVEPDLLLLSRTRRDPEEPGLLQHPEDVQSLSWNGLHRLTALS